MGDTVIEIQALRKEYYEVVAVADVSLGIARGHIYGLIGPNGAGKTTLLRMLATTLEPTGGRVLFDGQDLWRDLTGTRRRIGFMPDFFQMYDDLKVHELLTYFGIAHGLTGRRLAERVEEVIALADLAGKRGALCKGLSRGMVQRLGLGRAILHEPELLLLDEPASGLDPLARRDLFGVLRKIHAAGATIVISSHILGELGELCDSVIIMHEGRFLETGPRDEIIRKVMPRRQITVRVVGGADSAAAALGVLGKARGVSAPGAEGADVRFAFDGDDAALAEVNAALVAGGVRVALVEETRASLHELYFAIAEGDRGGTSR